MSGCSYSVKTSREPVAKKLVRLYDSRWGGTDRLLKLTWKHFQQRGSHPWFFLFCILGQTLPFQETSLLPQIVPKAHTPSVQTLAGESKRQLCRHPCAPSHAELPLKHEEDSFKKPIRFPLKKTLILCYRLNKLYSFPSSTFIPKYSTISEIA